MESNSENSCQGLRNIDFETKYEPLSAENTERQEKGRTQ